MEREVIRESRGKTALFLGLCLAFVSIAVFVMPREPLKNALEALLCGGLFSLLALVFCVRLLKPGSLILDHDGFTVSDLFGRPHKTLWRDVSEFFEWRLPRGGKVIAFNYLEGRSPKSGLLGIARRLGAEGTVTGLYGGSRADMMAKLNGYRTGALRSPS